MIDHLLDKALKQSAPPQGGLNTDDALIELLGRLAESGPGGRREVLGVLLHTPERFWSAERLEGAVAALAPVASDEDTDDLSPLHGTVLGALFSHFTATTGTKGERHFLDTLINLLDARSADLRGFAASMLGRAGVGSSVSSLAAALAREPRWDVALRIMGALKALGKPATEDALGPLLDAPTEEALIYAARQIRAARALGLRPDLMERLQIGVESTEVRGELQGALKALDLVDARIGLDDLSHTTDLLSPPEGHPDLEIVRFCDFQGRRASLEATATFDPDTDEVELALTVLLPGEHSDNTPHYKHLTHSVAKILGLEVDPAHSDMAGEGVIVRLPLRGDPPLTVFKALGPILTDIEETLHPFDRPSARRPEQVNAAMEDLLERLSRFESRRELLTAFARPIRARDGSALLCLDSDTIEDASDAPCVSFVLAFDKAALTQPDPASGLLLAFSIDGAHEIEDNEGFALIQQGLIDTIAWKLDLTFDLDERDDLALFEATEIGRGDHSACLQGHTGPAEHFEDFLGRCFTLGSFLRNLGRFTAHNANLFELLGLATPPKLDRAIMAPFKDPQAELLARREKLEALRRRRADRAPEVPEVRPEPPSTAPALSLPSAPALPPSLPSTPSRPSTPTLPSAPAATAIEWPPREAITQLTPESSATPRLPSTPALPSSPPTPGTQSPSATSKGLQPLDEKGRTPREVVRDLSAGIARVDIYLRFAGYNTSKLAQIMGILLGMEKPEVLEIIERSPCLLTENIPRDRARQIKTVLEGTGAKIAIVAPGEDL